MYMYCTCTLMSHTIVWTVAISASVFNESTVHVLCAAVVREYMSNSLLNVLHSVLYLTLLRKELRV